MTEPLPALDPDEPQPARPPDEAQPLLARLDALRREGAARLDPTRFRYLEVMARRLASQPPPVRALLEDRLLAALAAYDRQLARARNDAAAATERLLATRPALAPKARQLQARGDLAALRRLAARPAQARCAPLAELNDYIRTAAARAAPTPQERPDGRELASAWRFRRAWESRRTLWQVEQAVARKPANAGPLNSHAQVLDSLALMRELSTDYLRRVVRHGETLQWLEQAGPKAPARTPKPARGNRAKK